jgi:hypothetical protein
MSEPKVRRVAIVACSRTKLGYPAPARELYAGRLFQASRAYAEATCDDWFIVSALHGLLRPEQLLMPYDYSLGRMQRAARVTWANTVAGLLYDTLPEDGAVVLVDLCGTQYGAPIRIAARQRSQTTVAQPLSGLGIGQRLSWLLQHTPGATAQDLLDAALAVGELADEIERRVAAVERTATEGDAR